MISTAHPTEEAIRVLFIEDDPAVAEMYKLKLELDGYQVTIVSGSEPLISASASLRPDLVYLDIRRREDDGIALLRALRARETTRDVPVIILAEHRPQEMATRGFSADVLDYVVRADDALTSLTRNI